MRRRRIATFLALLLIASGIAFVLWYNALPQRMDREFEAVWSRIRPSVGAPREPLQREVDRICKREGTNAIPTLLDWIEEGVNERGQMVEMSEGVLWYLSSGWRDRIAERQLKRAQKGFAAAHALRLYGSAAGWVLPRLRAMDRDSDGRPKFYVLIAVQSIGEDEEAFVESLRSSHPRPRAGGSD